MQPNINIVGSHRYIAALSVVGLRVGTMLAFVDIVDPHREEGVRQPSILGGV